VEAKTAEAEAPETEDGVPEAPEAEEAPEYVPMSEWIEDFDRRPR
jgi:hypothetical protein